MNIAEYVFVFHEFVIYKMINKELNNDKKNKLCTFQNFLDTLELFNLKYLN